MHAASAGRLAAPYFCSPSGGTRLLVAALSMQPQEIDPFHNGKRASINGFVGWIFVNIAWIVYLLWAFIPDRVLASFGITYYPAKHWALALPLWAMFSVVTIVVLYAMYNMMHKPPLTSLQNVVDEYTREPGPNDRTERTETTIPTIIDEPIYFVTRRNHAKDWRSCDEDWPPRKPG